MNHLGWEAVTSQYVAYLRRRGSAPGTIHAYSWALEDFGRWVGPLGVQQVSDIVPVHVESWLDDLADRGRALRSRALAAAALRGCFRWARRHDFEIDKGIDDAIVHPKIPKLQPKPIEPGDVDLIAAHLLPLRPRAGVQHLRTRALWFYLVTTGARISEALSVNRDEIGRDQVVVTQKGGTSKALWASPLAMTTVRDYLRRRQDTHQALFVTHCGPVRRLSVAGAQSAWEQLAAKVGVPRFTNHQLRHTCATELLEADVPIEVVAEHLGHHGLASVMGYAAVSQRRRAVAVHAMQERFGRTKTAAWQPVVVKGGRGRRTELY